MKLETQIYIAASALRFWRGTVVNAPRQTQPAQTLKLYDIEACPHCRLVREQLTELDLDVMILPCPKKGRRFRPEAERIAGKQQFPLLVDDNTGAKIYEAAAIIDYLHRTYGDGQHGARQLLTVARHTSKMASALVLATLGMAGLRAHPSRAPAQPLELYGFESSPYTKPVRARLCELELPYLLRNTGKGALNEIGRATFGGKKQLHADHGSTANRDWLAKNTGKIQVPYLIDNNTGVTMFESADIVAYLDRTYALPAVAPT
jgi:glutathione S-transferase